MAKGWFSKKHYAALLRNPEYKAAIVMSGTGESRQPVLITHAGEPSAKLREDYKDYSMVAETPGSRLDYLAYGSGNLTPLGMHYLCARKASERNYGALMVRAANYFNPDDEPLLKSFINLRRDWQIKNRECVYSDDIRLDENRWNHTLPPARRTLQ